MKVSILIPLKDSEKFVAETIQSALGQTWQNTEIIIIDDGSTDNSLSIAKSFESEKVKVLSQVNRGAAAARNIAYRISTGNYIQFLDADDLLSPDKIEKQLNLAAENNFNEEFIYTCPTHFFSKDINNSEAINQPTDRSYYDPIELLTDLFTYNSFISSHAYLTPRYLIDRGGLWDEELSANDDGDFFARIIFNSKRIIFCDKVITYYRESENSLSKQKSSSHVISEYQSLKNISEIILRYKDSSQNRLACSMIFNWFINDWFPENKSILGEVEKTMNKMGLTYFSASESRVFHFIKKEFGWRRALLLSDMISKVKSRL